MSGKPIGKHNDTIEHHADGSSRYRRFSETCLEESTGGERTDRATCEKIAGAAVRSTGRPRYRSENRSVIVGCRIYQRRQRRGGVKGTRECVLLEAQATIAGSQRLRGRPLGLSPVERDRPRPQRERNAPVICMFVCVCVCVSVLRAYACTGATGHRDTKGLEAHDRRRSHSRSRLYRVAAGISARGIPDYRARADCTPS